MSANLGTVSIEVIANDGNGGTVAANFDIVAGTTLPVSLNEYNAKLLTDGTVMLSWDTFSEQNNDYFEVSRSTDGQNFAVIGAIKGKGNSNQRNLYNYLDKTPKSGNNYYKLVQVDLDEKRKELGIRSAKVTLANEPKITVYPNPGHDVVNVLFESGRFSIIELINLNGKLIQKKIIPVQATEVAMEVRDLPSASYLIKLIGNKETVTRVLIVKR